MCKPIWGFAIKIFLSPFYRYRRVKGESFISGISFIMKNVFVSSIYPSFQTNLDQVLFCLWRLITHWAVSYFLVVAMYFWRFSWHKWCFSMLHFIMSPFLWETWSLCPVTIARGASWSKGQLYLRMKMKPYGGAICLIGTQFRAATYRDGSGKRGWQTQRMVYNNDAKYGKQ